MIYSNWGCEVKIIGYLGKHKCPGITAERMLVRAERTDPETRKMDIKHYFAFSLRADGGINEIEAAIDAAPELKVVGKELKDAIKDAA